MSATRLVALLVVVIVAAGIGLTVLDGEGGVRQPRQPRTSDRAPRPSVRRRSSSSVSTPRRSWTTSLGVATSVDGRATRPKPTSSASTTIEASLVALQPDSFSRVTPLGYRVERLTADSADVAVWAVSLAIVSEQFPVVVGWRAAEVGLVLEDGEWRVATVSDADAPTPDSPAPRFRAESAQFEEYRLAP